MDLEPIQKDYPNYKEVSFYLGKAFLYNGDIDKAKECFEKIKQYPQGDSPLEGLLAWAYWVKEDKDKAAECLKKAIVDYPYPIYKEVQKKLGQ